MSIKTIEIICKPCPKCDGLEKRIRDVVRNIEIANQVKIEFEFKHTKELKNLDKYGIGPAQTPVIIVNGNVEFAGKMDNVVLKQRLDSLHRMG